MQAIKFSYRAKATTGAVVLCVIEEYAFECAAVEAGLGEVSEVEVTSMFEKRTYNIDFPLSK